MKPAMRTLFALLLWASSVTNGSTQSADSTRLSIQWGTDSEDLNDILTYSRMDFYKVAISDKKVAGKILQFRVREFYNGVDTRNTDPFATTSKERFRVCNQSGDWTFKFICDKSKLDSVSFFLKFPIVSIPRKYSTLSSKMYSLRNATFLVGKNGLRIFSGALFSLLPGD
jgi:hypothetical protein